MSQFLWRVAGVLAGVLLVHLGAELAGLALLGAVAFTWWAGGLRLPGRKPQAACMFKGSAVARLVGGSMQQRDIARHEGGHYVTAQYCGGSGTRANLWPGGGYTSTSARLTVAEHVAFLRAGEYAIGSGKGASWDRNKAASLLRSLPADQRAEASAEADRIVRRAYSGGRVDRIAQRLLDHGKA